MTSLAERLPSVLVANRGEIACRIFRTAKALGLRTIAVYSDADADAPFVRAADVAVNIGPAPARESYLVAEKIIAAARQTGAAAIHPGYGFLSENAEFAEACATAGIVFVGPPPSAIRAMGLKDASKRLAEEAGVPVVPGYHGTDQDEALLAREAARIGFPLLIKAVAGGGGKGMKRVDTLADFADALASARREGQAAFGNPDVLIEKYVRQPRHIEVQVFADSHGHVVHLFERDCSLQRRHQKVIEEAPAPGMTGAMRKAMTDAAVALARSVGYVGAGTVEFIVDGSEGLREDRFYFMEMNTRLQVEHPVTEAITGFDLVELQLRVAAGEALPFMQDDLVIHGHAVEARLYAEDPQKGFLPSTGEIHILRFSEGAGIRIDTGVESGSVVTPFYDPMIAKVIAQADTRDGALDLLAAALRETVVVGPVTNGSFLWQLADLPEFRAGKFDTGLIERHFSTPEALSGARKAMLLRDALQELASLQYGRASDADPWAIEDAFALVSPGRRGLLAEIDGETVSACQSFRLDEQADGGGLYSGGLLGVTVDGASAEDEETSDFRYRVSAECAPTVLVVRQGRQHRVVFPDPLAVDLDALDVAPGDAVVKSPMHGKVVAVFVALGETVTRGQRIAVVEAMKMEHVLTAPRDGEIADLAATVGQQVAEGARIVLIHAVEG